MCQADDPEQPDVEEYGDDDGDNVPQAELDRIDNDVASVHVDPYLWQTGCDRTDQRFMLPCPREAAEPYGWDGSLTEVAGLPHAFKFASPYTLQRLCDSLGSALAESKATLVNFIAYAKQERLWSCSLPFALEKAIINNKAHMRSIVISHIRLIDSVEANSREGTLLLAALGGRPEVAGLEASFAHAPVRETLLDRSGAQLKEAISNVKQAGLQAVLCQHFIPNTKTHPYVDAVALYIRGSVAAVVGVQVTKDNASRHAKSVAWALRYLPLKKQLERKGFTVVGTLTFLSRYQRGVQLRYNHGEVDDRRLVAAIARKHLIVTYVPVTLGMDDDLAQHFQFLNCETGEPSVAVFRVVAANQ